MHHRRLILCAVALLFASLAGCSSPSGPGGNGGSAGSTPDHLFPCGTGSCHSGSEYCLHVGYQAGCADLESDVCEPYPQACGAHPSCACLPASDCSLIGEPECSEQNGEISTCYHATC